MSVRSVLSHAGHPQSQARDARDARADATRVDSRARSWCSQGSWSTSECVRRRVTTSGPANAHARSLVHLEQMLGIAREGDLQRLIIHHHTLVTLANWVYIWGHWPLIVVSAAWLFRHRPDAYRLMRTAIFVSGAIGMMIFLLYPVAPPRLTGLGLTDTVTELLARLPRAAATVVRWTATPPCRACTSAGICSSA